MSEPNESTPTGTLSPPPPAPTPRRGSCIGRLVSAFLVVLITTLISLAVVALVYLFVFDTPNQLADLRGRAVTAEAINAALRTQNDTMQTQIADLARRADANREALGELQQQKAALDGLRADLEAAARQNATVVAEARTSRDDVALFATAEAGRAQLLDDLKRRSERLERFLQRLSDISNDAALDLGAGATPSPASAAATPSEVPTSSPAPTITPADTPTPSPTPTARATATAPTEPTASERPTTRPSVTPTP